jgi:hypothetical protein
MRSSFLLHPAGLVIGYLLALFADTAGVVGFPFSCISLGLWFVVVEGRGEPPLLAGRSGGSAILVRSGPLSRRNRSASWQHRP